jgi:predicted oxidoreductase (fatty acid repression mutant protein)
MIKHLLRKLLPPQKVRTEVQSTRFEKALQILVSEDRSILMTLFSQWVLLDKNFPTALQKASPEVQKAWILVARNHEGPLQRDQIIADFKNFLTKSTDEAVKTIERLQAR